MQLMVDVVSTSLPHIKGGKLRTGGDRPHPAGSAAQCTHRGGERLSQCPGRDLVRPRRARARPRPRPWQSCRPRPRPVLKDPQFRATFGALGLVIQQPRTQAEIDRYIEADREHWGKVIRANNISLD
ncbi:hypothetical protein ACU4GD_44005 [Cupriavidus basilensis]